MNAKELSELALTIVGQPREHYLTPAQVGHLNTFANQQDIESVSNAWGKSLALAIARGAFMPLDSLMQVSENIWRCSEGYRYFDGIRVEHYSFEPERTADERMAALKLEANCLRVLCQRLPVNGRTAISTILETAPYHAKWKAVACTHYAIMERANEPLVLLNHVINSVGDVRYVHSMYRDDEGKAVVKMHEGAYEGYHEYRRMGYESVCEPLATYEMFHALMEKVGIPLTDILRESGYDFLQ